MTPIKTLSRGLGFAVSVTLMVLVFFVTPALAGGGYEKVTGTFGSEGSGPGLFKEPTSVAVNDATGDVYVLDSGNDRIEWFTAEGKKYEGQFNGSGTYEDVEGSPKVKTGAAAPTGEFLDPTEIAVNNHVSSTTHGDVYVADTGHDVVDEFSATGEYKGQFTGGKCENEAEAPPCASGKLVPFKGRLDVAVDPSGDLWVYEGEAPQAYEFSDLGSFIEKFETNEGSTDPGFAVDSSGDLYVVRGGTPDTREVLEFEKATGSRKVRLTESAKVGTTLAMISSTNDLLVDEGSSIELFKSPITGGASPLLTFPATGLSESAGIAVNGALGEGTIYATQRGADDVDVIESEPPKAPEVVPGSESASSVRNGNYGEFAAVINPGNRTTTYTFEYATSEAELLAGNGTKVPGETTLPAEFGNQTVTSPELNLYSLATFYYRVVAENEVSKGNPTDGPAQSYTKLPLVAKGEEGEEKVSSLTSTGATLEATINPVFEGTTYAFEYAENEAELKNDEGTVIHGTTGFYQQQKLQELTKLEETLAIEEANGEVPPGTVPICPGIVEQGGTGELPGVNKPCPISAEIASLTPGHTYYYRIAAENEVTREASRPNEGEPVHGEIKELKPYAPPSITTGEAQNITRTSATLSGTVNPERTEATYHFAYISETGYQEALKKGAANPASPHYQEELTKGTPSPYTEGETTEPHSLPASEESLATGPVAAEGLLPGITYHYALIATNKFEIQTTSPDHTFTTTTPTPPSASTGGANGVSQNTATLYGTVTTNGLQTSYGFEIGTEPGNYGPPTGLGSVGGALTEEVHVTLGELEPGTTYYYRVTATNADGTIQGQPGTFTTPGFPTLITPPASPAPFAFTKVAFPKEEKETGTGTAKGLTDKQKLAKALKQCKREKGKKRSHCEATARQKYGAVKKAKKGKKK